MCGIVGYIGGNEAAPVLLTGLEKLEYRGYDSAGVAVYDGTHLQVAKAKGRLQVLKDLVHGGADVPGCVGIGHTRWATHGAPSDVNSHPQVSDSGKFAVVHNGIIENYLSIKRFLTKKGVTFVSETDTEVVAQLLEYYYEGSVLDAVAKVLDRVEGSYALGILCADDPGRIYAVKKDSPLIIGLGEGANYLASDIPAFLAHTREVVRLQDKEIAVLTPETVEVYNADREPVQKTPEHIDWDVSAAEKGGFEHFMAKEIMEQPKALRDTINPRIKNGRIVLDDMTLTREQLLSFHRIFIVACGTAYHVGVVTKYLMEKELRVPVEVDIASEFRYRTPLVDEHTLVIVISQSGETADTLAALRESKKLGARVLSIVNVVGSSIALDSDDVLYTWAGPEIAVASTKAYSTQLAMGYLLTVYMGDLLGTIDAVHYQYYVNELLALPEKVEQILEDKETVQFLASQEFNARNVFFIGRNLDYAMGLEGSLKLKEISYIHSEAYAAGELKHGPISLVEDGTLVIALATQDILFDKMMSNVKEVKARGAVVWGMTTEANRKRIGEQVDYTFCVPKACDMMLPSLAVIPLQLFAYYVASLKGCDIDKPRNLAKSVTVE